MAMRLALLWGVPDPDEILRRMTASQLTEWQAYYRQHPFGQDHTDFLIAQLTAVLANAHRAKNSMPAKPTDFLPIYVDRGQSAEEIETILRASANG